jgi:hypothetical protein
VVCRAVSVSVIEMDVVLVVILVNIVVGVVEVSVVVTTRRVEEDEEVCIRVVITVTAEGTPRQGKVSMNRKCQGR